MAPRVNRSRAFRSITQPLGNKLKYKLNRPRKDLFLHNLMNYLKRFRGFIGQEVWRLFWLSSLTGFLLFLAESSFVVVLQGFLLAVGLVPADRTLLPDWYPRSVNGAIWLLIAFGFGRGLVMIAKSYLASRTHQAFMVTQRQRIMRYCLYRAGEASTPEMVALFTERVSSVGGAFNGCSQILLFLTSNLFLAITAAALAPVELLIGITMLAIFLFPLRFLNKTISRAGEGLVQEWENSSRSLIQGLRHHFYFKVYCLIDREAARGRQSLDNYSGHFRTYNLYAAIKSSLPMMVGVLVVSVITIVSQQYIGTHPAKLISFFYLFVRISQGASEMMASLNEFRLQYPGYQQLLSFYERTLLPEKNPAPAKALEKALSPAFTESLRTEGVAIDIQGLGFSYDDGAPLLKDFSLSVRRGDRLVIQGESGSGKSTLLSLILGVLTPQSGEVLVNGKNVREVRELLAASIGYVGPEPFLIEGSVRDNLLYGHPFPREINEEEIWECVNRAQLADTIRALPQQLNERLYELTQLSTGQKQRMAIARALLRRPKLLILDEASANLDPETEKLFISSLEPLFAGLTVIVISHKDSFNQVATRLLRMGEQS